MATRAAGAGHTEALREMGEQSRPSRLLSLDLLRGLTIGFMILVNDNGDEAHSFWPFKHAAWNGFTPTDLVFPTFLLLVGVTTVLSISSRTDRGESRLILFRHVVRRSVILFLLGLLVNSFPLFHLHTMRFYGVLPRIAICYFVVASLYLLSPGWRSKAGLAVGLLLGYWVLMRFVPVPGYGLPGRDVPLLDRDGNLAAWIDRHVFSAPHLYEHTRDPEGLLSTLPAIATSLIGVLTGIWLRSGRALGEKVRGIAVAGVTGLLLGGAWNFAFPINKKLWTSSYVLFAAGWSLLLMALAMRLVDIPSAKEAPSLRSQRSPYFTPFLVFGTNAITAYVLSELLAGLLSNIAVRPHLSVSGWIYHGILSVVPVAPWASLLYALLYTTVCWLLVLILYKRRIFLKV